MKLAIITLIETPNEIFNVWLSYYSKIVDPEHIYILYRGGNTLNLGKKYNIIQESSNDVVSGNESVNAFKDKLLASYEYVLYTDHDEIFYPKNGFTDLLNSKKPYYTASGFEIVQKRSEESIINFNDKILSQRKYWIKNEGYDKTLLTSKKIKWSYGFHTIFEMPKIMIPDLYLIHLKYIDYAYMNKLHKELNKTGSNMSPVARSGGVNPMIDNSLEANFNFLEKKLEVIPAEILNSNLF